MKRLILIITSLVCIIACTRINTDQHYKEEILEGNTNVSVLAPTGFDVRDMRVFLFGASDKFVREVSNVQKSLNAGIYTYSMDIAPGMYSMLLVGNSQGLLDGIYSGSDISSVMYQMDQSASYMPNSPEILYVKIPNVSISKDAKTSLNSIVLTRNVAMLKLVIDRSQLQIAGSESKTQSLSIKNMRPSLSYNGKLLSPVAAKTMIGYFNITKQSDTENYISDTLTFVIPANNSDTATDIVKQSLKIDFSGKRKDGSIYKVSDVVIPNEPRANKIMIIRLSVDPNSSILVSTITFKDWNAPITIPPGTIPTGISAGKITTDKPSYLKGTTTLVSILSAQDALPLLGTYTISWKRQKDLEVAVNLSGGNQTYVENISSLPVGKYTYTRQITDRYGNVASTSTIVRYKDVLKLFKHPNNWFAKILSTAAYFNAYANDPEAVYSWYKDNVLVASGVNMKKFKVGEAINTAQHKNYKLIVSNEFSRIETLPKQVYHSVVGDYPYDPEIFTFGTVLLPKVSLKIIDRNLGATQVCPDPNSITPPKECVGAYFQWAHECPMAGSTWNKYDDFPDISTTSWTQGPCPTGYHVLTTTEWTSISSSYTSDEIRTLLKLPRGGYEETDRYPLNPYLEKFGLNGMYWLADPVPGKEANAYYLNWEQIQPTITKKDCVKKQALNVRCVADY